MAGVGRREAGALEREVVAALAAARAPMTAHEVLDELDNDLAYTTVLTTLNRLADKGAVTKAPGTGRAHTYVLNGTPRDLPAAITARRMNRLLGAGTDRERALTHFVEELTPTDEALLNRLLSQRGSAGSIDGPTTDRTRRRR